MEFKLVHKQTQSLVMTPQLQQAIKLLQLSRLELIDQVREEMMENPILDEQPEAAEADRVAHENITEPPVIEDREAFEARGENRAQGPDEQRAVSESRQEEYWERFLESYANQGPMPSGGSRGSSEEMPSLEQTLSSRTSLSDHIEWQLRLSNFRPTEMRFANLVVNNLDDSGYLNLRAIAPPKNVVDAAVVPEIRAEAHADELVDGSVHDDFVEGVESAQSLDEAGEPPPAKLEGIASRAVTIDDLAREAGLDPEDAEEVLRLIQLMDPVGVAARDLRECLMVQAEVWGYDRDDIVWQVLDRHLPNVEKRNFPAIARDLKCELEDVYEAAKIISTLEPRPGRNFVMEDPPYITPDVYVTKAGDDYVVTTNDDGLPKLKINVEQAQALMKDPKAKQFVQEKLNSARWFVRSLDQRQKTIVKVTQCIVEKQRDFFERGIEYLRPMILRDVAESVGMHESTISRVTTNKYVHTPRGIFELKYFFNSSIKRMADENIASESVKQAIKKIIGEEEPKNPLSDEQIVRRLQEQKIVIARRTVAKYREMLGILSSAKRKQYY